MAVRANTGQSPDSVSTLGQRRIRLTGIEPAMGWPDIKTVHEENQYSMFAKY